MLAMSVSSCTVFWPHVDWCAVHVQCMAQCMLVAFCSACWWHWVMLACGICAAHAAAGACWWQHASACWWHLALHAACIRWHHAVHASGMGQCMQSHSCGIVQCALVALCTGRRAVLCALHADCCAAHAVGIVHACCYLRFLIVYCMPPACERLCTEHACGGRLSGFVIMAPNVAELQRG